LGLVERAAAFGGARGHPRKPKNKGEISMSVATHEAENSTAMLAPMLRALLHVVRTAVEAHAGYRVKSAVSPSRSQQADREIRRLRRLMHAGN
jgi:flagellar biosynthesis regulator FlbT